MTWQDLSQSTGHTRTTAAIPPAYLHHHLPSLESVRSLTFFQPPTTSRRMAHDSLEDADERAEAAWRAVLAATAKVSRIHAEAPSTATDIEALIADLAACRSVLDVFSATMTELQLDASSQSIVDESVPTQTTIQSFGAKCDKLDREGVMLWNRSSVLRHLMSAGAATPAEPESPSTSSARRYHDQRLIAFMRLTAAHFMHAGTPVQSAQDSTGAVYSYDDAVWLLDLYSKSITELTECNEFGMAGKPSESSTDLLKRVQQVLETMGCDDADTSSAAGKTAMIAHHLSCSYLACIQGDTATCQRLLAHATEIMDTKQHSSRDIEAVIQHLYQISCRYLKLQTSVLASQRKQTRSKQDNKAVETHVNNETRVDTVQILVWLQQGLQLLDREECSAARHRHRFDQWRVKLLKALGQAYLSDSQQNSAANAENALNDLLKIESNFATNKTKLWLLLRRRAPDAEVEVSLDACLRSMVCRESDITALIKEIHQVPPTNYLLLRKSLKMIVQALLARHKDGGQLWLYLPFMATCLGLTNSQKDASDLEDLLNLIEGDDNARSHRLLPEVAFACQSHLWKLADSQLKQANFILAATWYRLITSHLFSALADSNGARSNRKRALCLLRADRIGEAIEVIGSAFCVSASDHYIRFLCAGLENREEQAITAMHDMSKCTDFQLDMLLWATKQAQQYQLKNLFRACLRKLIDLASQGTTYDDVSCLALIKALVSDTIEENNDSYNEDGPAFLCAVTEQFYAALHVLQHHKDRSTFGVSKERCDRIKYTTWFYKKAVNIAKTYVALVPAEEISRLLEYARVFASLLIQDAHVSAIDAEEMKQVTASERILTWTSRLLQLEKYVGTEVVGGLDDLGEEVLSTRLQDLDALSEAWQAGDGPSLVPKDLQASVFAYKFEILARYRRWQEAMACLDDCRRHSKSLPVSLYQRLAHVACSSLDTPAELSTHALEILMEVIYSLKGVNMCVGICKRISDLTDWVFSSQVAKFIRAIVATTLERGNHTLATKYLNSALTLMNRVGKDFPRSEAEWLCTVCWNLGIDHANSNVVKALDWCSRAIQFASSIPGFGDTQELMQSHYNQLQDAYLAHGTE